MHRKVFFGLLAMLLLSGLAHSARVSGTVWDAVKMEPGAGIAVEINTTPMQREITGPDGSYFFDLGPGSFELAVKKITPKHELEQVAAQAIVISKEGNYTLDLLAFYSDISVPDLGNESEFELPSIPDQNKVTHQKPDDIFVILLAAAFLALTLLIGTYYLFGKMKGEQVIKPEPKEPKSAKEMPESKKEEAKEEKIAIPIPQKREKIPSDLKQIIQIMKRNEGRMTQKDLRKEIPLSEAKVSLMITDLENRGLVRRIKQGRGNVLILKGDS